LGPEERVKNQETGSRLARGFSDTGNGATQRVRQPRRARRGAYLSTRRLSICSPKRCCVSRIRMIRVCSPGGRSGGVDPVRPVDVSVTNRRICLVMSFLKIPNRYRTGSTAPRARVEGACCGAASVSDKSPGALGSEIACLEVPPDESPSLRSECQRDHKPERSRSHGTRRGGQEA